MNERSAGIEINVRAATLVHVDFWSVHHPANSWRESTALTTRAEPLVLRFLLHIHEGPLDIEWAKKIAMQFRGQPGFEVVKANVKHQQFSVRRLQLRS